MYTQVLPSAGAQLDKHFSIINIWLSIQDLLQLPRITTTVKALPGLDQTHDWDHPQV